MSAYRWGVGVCLGLSLAACSYLLLRPDPLEGVGRKAGYANPRTFSQVHRLQTAADLSGSSLADLDKLCDDPDWRVRGRALSVLSKVPNRERAAAIAMRKISDAEPVVRVYALGALERLRSPEALVAARTLVKDADPSVRDAAKKVLGEQ